MKVVYASLCDSNEKVQVPLENFKRLPLQYIKKQKYKVKIGDKFKDAIVLHVAGKDYYYPRIKFHKKLPLWNL